MLCPRPPLHWLKAAGRVGVPGGCAAAGGGGAQADGWEDWKVGLRAEVEAGGCSGAAAAHPLVVRCRWAAAGLAALWWALA